MKLISEAGFFMCSAKSYQLSYGLQRAVLGLLVELAPRLVERGHAGLAGAGDVERAEVERQADQVVAQRVGHVLVDLVADLSAHAAQDGAGRRIGVDAAGVERDRIEEGVDQADVVGLLARDLAVSPSSRSSLDTSSVSMEWPKR